MISVLPHKEDFDYIADITGDESWRAVDFEPTSPHSPGMIYRYTKKVEKWLPIKLSDFGLLGKAPDVTKILFSAVRSQGLGSVISNIGDLSDSDKVLNPNSLLTVSSKKEYFPSSYEHW